MGALTAYNPRDGIALFGELYTRPGALLHQICGSGPAFRLYVKASEPEGAFGCGLCDLRTHYLYRCDDRQIDFG